jgi:hypothetical protein
MAALDAEVRKYDAQPHYGAVVFVDQVEVIDAGKPTSSVARLDQSLFPFIAAADSNLQPDFETPNSEDAENGLDALHAAATQFEWRDPVDALHLVVYLGDGPIAGRGQALGSVTVQHGYAAVAEAMDDAEARVVGFTPSGTRGFRRAWSDEATLPEQTGGTAFSLQRFEDGRLSLRTALADLLKNPVCERPLL